MFSIKIHTVKHEALLNPFEVVKILSNLGVKLMNRPKEYVFLFILRLIYQHIYYGRFALENNLFWMRHSNCDVNYLLKPL